MEGKEITIYLNERPNGCGILSDVTYKERDTGGMAKQFGKEKIVLNDK